MQSLLLQQRHRQQRHRQRQQPQRENVLGGVKRLKEVGRTNAHGRAAAPDARNVTVSTMLGYGQKIIVFLIICFHIVL